MVRILIQCADAFRVNDQDVNWRSIRLLSLDGRAPDPQAFCARVDRRAHAEAALSVQYHAVHVIALARAVHAHHRDHPDGRRNLFQDLHCLAVHHVLFS